MAQPAGNSLDRIPFFQALSGEEQEKCERACVWRHYQAQEQIFDRDDNGNDIYFVVSGVVRVVNYSLSGREISFEDIEAGDFFGELAAIDGQGRSASVIALEKTTVVSITPNRFEAVLYSCPSCAMAMMRHLSATLRQATKRIMDLSTLGANNRIHAEVLRLAMKGREDGETAVIQPIPHHGEIASRVSTTRETVARAFSDLARSGVIERGKDAILIPDILRLESLVESALGE